MRSWSKDVIAVAILARHRAGKPVHYTAVEREDLPLLRAACYHYGAWREAVEAAGLDYDAVRRHKGWSKEAIVARIQELYVGGHDLSWTHVSRSADPQMAACAVKKHRFGSWRAAVEAAGLDYAEVSRYRRWTAERVIRELRRLARSGQPLNSKAVQTNHCALFTAGRRRFGSWDGALSAAGLHGAGTRPEPPAPSGVPHAASWGRNGAHPADNRHGPGLRTTEEPGR